MSLIFWNGWLISQELMLSISTLTLSLFYQGGDLIKWDKAKIGYYVGIDIAEGSVNCQSVKLPFIINCRFSCKAALNLYSLMLICCS